MKSILESNRPEDGLTQLLGEKIEAAYGIKLPPRRQLTLI